MKTPKTRKPKTRLPSLKPERLAQISKLMAATPIIPAVAQDAVMQSLIAATNPQAESPSAVIASLDKDDQEAVRTAQAGYVQTMNRMNARGRAALLGMSDAEWKKATGQSENGGEDANATE